MIEKAEKPKHYVTITHGIRGHFVVLLELVNDEICGEFYEPLNSGYGSYATAKEAIPEALEWAEAEEVPFQLAGYDSKGQPIS